MPKCHANFNWIRQRFGPTNSFNIQERFANSFNNTSVPHFHARSPPGPVWQQVVEPPLTYRRQPLCRQQLRRQPLRRKHLRRQLAATRNRATSHQRLPPRPRRGKKRGRPFIDVPPIYVPAFEAPTNQEQLPDDPVPSGMADLINDNTRTAYPLADSDDFSRLLANPARYLQVVHFDVASRQKAARRQRFLKQAFNVGPPAQPLKNSSSTSRVMPS